MEEAFLLACLAAGLGDERGGGKTYGKRISLSSSALLASVYYRLITTQLHYFMIWQLCGCTPSDKHQTVNELHHLIPLVSWFEERATAFPISVCF
jgi:hypothetical protein